MPRRDRTSEPGDDTPIGDEAQDVNADDVEGLEGGVDVVEGHVASLEGGVHVVDSHIRPPVGETTVRRSGGVEIAESGSPRAVPRVRRRHPGWLAVLVVVFILALALAVLLLGG